MSDWFYKHHGLGIPPWETYSPQEISEAPYEIQREMRKFNCDQRAAERKNEENYHKYLFHEKRKREAEQREIRRLEREEEKRLQKEEEEAEKHFEEKMEQLRVDITRDVVETLRKQEKQEKEEEYYLTQPAWYLFENTDTGELISIALTGDEKKEFLKIIPTLKQIAKQIAGGGRNHQWLTGHKNIKKIRTRYDD